MKIPLQNTKIVRYYDCRTLAYQFICLFVYVMMPNAWPKFLPEIHPGVTVCPKNRHDHYFCFKKGFSLNK